MKRTLCALALLAIGCGTEREDAGNTARARMQDQADQLRLALKERPESPLLEYRLGQLFAGHGLMDSARAAFERSLALHEAFPEAHLEMAQIYFSQGLLDKSARSYEQAVRFDPKNAAAHNNLGYVYKLSLIHI